MAGQDYSEQLKSVVADILLEDDLDTFEEYWQLSQFVLGNTPIRRFYVRTDDGYANVALLTNDLIVDIEGEDDDSEGSLTLNPIRVIDSVRFHEGSVETIPESSEALLVLFVSVFGSTDVGPYWIAYSEEESRYLTLFGKAVVEAIADL
ncbi:MAG: hypothetical protein IIC83_10435 [Chloroflexi bacterium]|nr:hypothetical protein [Chloroflexota bacterium]